MPGRLRMRLVSINRHIPEMLARAPHKFWILEMGLDQLSEFETRTVEILNRFKEIGKIDDKTNIHVIGLNGDKGNLPTEYVKKTHAFILDFRPLGVEVIYWKCIKPTKWARSKVKRRLGRGEKRKT